MEGDGDSGELRLCIPSNNELKTKIIFSEHDDPSRGHPEIDKTFKFIQRKYFWPRMHKEVTNMLIVARSVCNLRNKHRQSKPPDS
jgi:Integrase zinc binding domain